MAIKTQKSYQEKKTMFNQNKTKAMFMPNFIKNSEAKKSSKSKNMLWSTHIWETKSCQFNE